MTIEDILKQAKTATIQMASLTGDQKNTALNEFGILLDQKRDFLISENKKDLELNKEKISSALFQRLELTEKKIEGLIQGVQDLIKMNDPVGRIEDSKSLEGDMRLEKISVPIGVIGVVFESRPDVNPQILSLILKSGNTVVLKGGSEAGYSNRAFQSLVKELNQKCDFLPEGWAQIIETREDFKEMLKYDEYLDLVIPRGSNQLVQTVMESTKAPVLGHADGVCHLYLDHTAHIEKAIALILNAKTQYPSGCNALETLLVEERVAKEFLLKFAPIAQEKKIEIRGCEKTRKILSSAEEVEDWHIEWGNNTLSIKIVSGLDKAIEHINTFGSHHTDGILSEDKEAQEKFVQLVDSASVYVNASTRFADGFQYGMGAEVGISTSKTHARGPVGIDGLVIYKYILRGSYSLRG